MGGRRAAGARAKGKLSVDGEEAEVITRDLLPEAEDGLAKEAAKGYDLTLVGMEPVQGPDGELAPRIGTALARIGGARGVVIARGALRDEPMSGPLRILVPVTTSDVSRRTVDFALALARADDATVTVLHVSPPGGPKAATGGGRLGRSSSSRQMERGIFGQIQALAAQQNLRVRTRVRVSDEPGEAIRRQARRTANTLIVMGVNRRPGDTFLLGATAAGLLEHAEQSLLLVAA